MDTTSTPGETYTNPRVETLTADIDRMVLAAAYTSPKSRLVTLLLAWFLGPLGGHRFYSGKTGTAIAMLLISFTVVGLLVTAVWAFIDFIMIAAGAFRDREGMLIKSWESRQ
jgi:TM2 domain-containing membrane protein YozV